MRVLTKNVKVYFECGNDCKTEPVETDVYDLIESGHPICSRCNEQMTLSDECLVTN